MPGSRKSASAGTTTGSAAVGPPMRSRATRTTSCACVNIRPATRPSRPSAVRPPPQATTPRRLGVPRSASPGAAVSATRRPDCSCRLFVSHDRTPSPASVPTRVGSTSSGEAPGLESTAALPTAPTRAKSTSPTVRRRAATMPRPAHTSARVSAIPTKRATLSLVPKVATARSLSQAGVRSTNASPTARTGDGVPSEPALRVRPTATTSATPRVIAPAAMPFSGAASGEAMSPVSHRVLAPEVTRP